MEIFLSVWLWLAQPFFPLQETVLHIYVLYDTNHDGLSEGVGEYVPVYVSSSDGTIHTYTDKNSHVAVLTEESYVRIEAYPRSTRLFYRWVCKRYVSLDEPTEHVVVDCFEQFFILFPFAEK